MFEYWRLKRKSRRNEQLLRDDDDRDPEAATNEQRYRRVTQLRTDLEKSRNLLCLIVKREKVKRQILRCEREIKLKELKYLGQKVQLSEATVSELTKTEAEPDSIIKSEADLAASFLDELDFDNKPAEVKKEPPPPPPKKHPINNKHQNRPKPGPKSRRPGPKSMTRPSEVPKPVPTFDTGEFF